MSDSESLPKILLGSSLQCVISLNFLCTLELGSRFQWNEHRYLPSPPAGILSTRECTCNTSPCVTARTRVPFTHVNACTIRLYASARLCTFQWREHARTLSRSTRVCALAVFVHVCVTARKTREVLIPASARNIRVCTRVLTTFARMKHPGARGYVLYILDYLIT